LIQGFEGRLPVTFASKPRSFSVVRGRAWSTVPRIR
jgi:hypothetical protein